MKRYKEEVPDDSWKSALKVDSLGIIMTMNFIHVYLEHNRYRPRHLNLKNLMRGELTFQYFGTSRP
jgi:hypothetical protein